jgi:RNA polymerase sigma factor (sigma-70 family)
MVEDRGVWFEDLCKNYYAVVLAFFLKSVPREAAEDLTQEAFLRVFRSRASVRGGGDYSLLLTTAKHVLLNHLRSRQAEKRRPEAAAVSVEEFGEKGGLQDRRLDGSTEGLNAEEALIKEERYLLLKTAIRELPEHERDALILSLEGFNGLEMARILGITHDATRARLSSARKRLRTRLLELTSEELEDGNDDREA